MALFVYGCYQCVCAEHVVSPERNAAAWRTEYLATGIARDVCNGAKFIEIGVEPVYLREEKDHKVVAEYFAVRCHTGATVSAPSWDH